MISGKSEKIGKSKESKRPALNVDKIPNFRQKGSGMVSGMGFIGVCRGRIGVLLGLWVFMGVYRGLWGF